MNPNTLENESAIILAANRGDFAAFRILYDSYQGAVKAVLKKMLFGYPGEVDDASQQVWMTAYFRLGFCDLTKGSFMNWICMRARWKAMEVLAYHRKHPLSYTDGPLEIPTHFEQPSARTTRLSSLETGALIEDLLKRLTDHERRVMEYVMADKPPVEIAEALGITRRAVDLTVWRARQKLKPFRHLVSAT